MQCECVGGLLLLVGVASNPAFPFIIGPNALIAMAFHFRAGESNPSLRAAQNRDDKHYDETLFLRYLKYPKRS